MSNNCLVTKLKSVVNNDNLLKLGEFTVDILPNKTFAVTWSGFDSIKDTIRIISGEGTISSIQDGYTFTAGTNGCKIGVSNKYQVNTLNATTDEVCYSLDCLHFKNAGNSFHTLSKGKLIGNIEDIWHNLINYSQILDLSEAKGNLDLSKCNFASVISRNNPNVSLTTTGTFHTIPGGEGTVFKPSSIQLTLFEPTARSKEATSKGINWIGNIETNLIANEYVNRIRLDGQQLTGRLEKYVEKLIASKNAGDFVRIYTNSAMTFHDITCANKGFVFNFNADTVTVTEDATGSAVIATYTKASGTWSYV